MSADNCIAIVKFSDGYRVIHNQAIENIKYYPVGSKERKEIIKEYFGDSELILSKDEALKEAYRLYEEEMEDFGIVEYGIIDLGELEDFE
jgi:hypothetical protein